MRRRLRVPGRFRVWDRLGFRFAAALCLGAAFILIGAAAWNLQAQRGQMTEMVRMSGVRSADLIRSATREAMLHNDPGELRRILDSIGQEGHVQRVRVFDPEGRIRTSTNPAEVGTLVSTNAEQCAACHASGRPLASIEEAERMRIFRAQDGERLLGVIAPIQNEPACSDAACHAHPASQRILGVLDVQLSLAGVDAAMNRSETQFLVGALGTVVAVLVLAWLLTWVMVLRPVRQLGAAAQRIGSGDLRGRIRSSARHELGELSRSWDRMAEDLERARGELEDWANSLQRRVDEKARELEVAHRQMVLVEKMASLGKLAAVVAHEINNPLTGIATYARLLHRREDFPEDTRRILQMIEEESARCGAIVRDLLLFSRTPGARFSEQQIGPLLERCRMLLHHQAELKGVELRVETAPDLPDVTCDPSQIQQLLVALAMNAIEATPEGGRIRVAARVEDDTAVLEIADTGRGIPSEDLPHIFEPFFSTKGEESRVGLGLAVAYGIVRRHKGRIDVKSEPGSGTVFRIVLPLHPEGIEDAETATVPAEAT
ncbi:MAG: ATP-binding protein [Acidobacteriota bacterium]|jgi:two-component system NtrC family sensor kinase